MAKVYDGQAELDISQFTKGLEDMERAATLAAVRIAAVFQSLDQNIQAALGNFQGHLSGVAQQISSIGAALASANGTLQQGGQQLQQSNQQMLNAARAGNQQSAQIRQAELQAREVDHKRSLQQQAQQNADRLKLIQSGAKSDLAALKEATAAEAQAVADKYARQRQEVEKGIAEQRRLQDTALQAAAQARRAQAEALTQNDPAKAQAADGVYRAAIQAAEQAASKHAALEKEKTAVTKAEAEARAQAEIKSQNEINTALRQGAQQGAASVRAVFGEAVAQARNNIKDVENTWNAVFRAGSQMSSMGKQLSAFSAGLTATGFALTSNAGDFDFWSRRVSAAAQAALGTTASDQEKAINSTQNFSDHILKLGRDLGTLKPDEVAQGWYLYQAAVGTAIKTTEDMALAQDAVTSILKAAIISDTDYETAIRGVTQAMAEFGLSADQTSHATAVMLNLTQTSQSEFRDVLESFKMIGPQAARLGMDIEEVSSIISRLSDNGIRGSTAGRALSVALGSILDPSNQADDALQHLLVTTQGLAGNWRDIVFKGGEFVGFLDTLNAKGEVVNQGFLHLIANATKGMTEAQRQSYLGAIFTNNATRALIPLIGEYVDAQNRGADATVNGKKTMEELTQEFRDATAQASLFNDQWQLVAESIKVRLGQATYGLREAMVRLGMVVADVFIPIVTWVSRAVNAFLDWGQTHPAIVRSLVAMGAAAAAAGAVFGPLLLIMGQLLQGIAAWNVAAKVLAESGGVVSKVITAMGGSIGALAGPVLVIIGVLGLLYVAWRTNFLGMGDELGKFFTALRGMASGFADIIENVLGLIGGLISGNSEQVQAAIRGLGVALLETFIVLPNQIAGALQETANAIARWANETMGWLVDSLAVWGSNLMISLANGIAEGAQYVYEAAWGVAEYIAQFFRSYSPPRFGPLMGIRTWGTNLIYSLIDGMNAADLGAIEEIAGQIGSALEMNIKAGNADASIYEDTMLLANEKVAEMIDIVKDGGRVTSDFFAPLQEGLGEWYDDVVNIALAYQDVYALENQISLEKQRLDLIKEQRKELDAQNQARQDAFDTYLGQTDASNYLNNQGEMVDPTTEEGKQRIEMMRQSLSKEDFQNWINFQKKLWDQKHDAEDKSLASQEDAEQTALDAAEKQLETVKTQYDYYVKMYEYAQRMADLAEKQQQLEEAKQRQAGQGTAYGTPEDLAAAKDEIHGKVGDDQLIQAEDKLAEAHGGDDVGGLADAVRQREREENRLSELEKLNRQKRADFESQLINATSDEERRRIKEQKDAWDAAYREEKARLQERVSFAKDVEDAAEKRADASKATREAGVEAQYQQQIGDLLGQQNGTIADANALKANSKDLNEAELKAQGQLRTEERALNDLRQLNDQKKLEFEQRLREAAGDPEKIRHIKEEQEAWETAYQKALEVQQARVEAARRAKQDLGDEDTANGPDGAKGPKGFSPDPFPNGPLGPTAPAVPQMPAMPAWMTNPPKPPEPPRQTKLEAEGMFDNLKRGIDFLTDKSVDSRSKLTLLGSAVQQALGWKTWWDALAPEQTRERIANGWRMVVNGVDKVWADTKESWTAFWTGLGKRWEEFKNGVSTSWNGFWTDVGAKWEAFKGGFKKGWDQYWDEFLKPVYAAVGLFYVLWVTFRDWWQGFWTGVTSWWKANVSEPFTKSWNDFWSGLTSWWQQNVSTPFTTWWQGFWNGLTSWWNTSVKEPFTANWNGFWSGIFAWWNTNVRDPFVKSWNEFWTGVGKRWTDFSKEVGDAWNKFWTDLTTSWNTFWQGIKKDWGQLWTDLGTAWETFKSGFSTKWNELWAGLGKAWNDFWSPLAKDWDSFISRVDSVFGKITSFFSSLETTINRLIRIGKSLLSLGGGGGNDDTDGSHEDGLYAVPFDGYRAELHRGERVLTAAEAALYNSVEKNGVLGALTTLTGAATARVAQATGPQTVNQQYTTVRQGDQKTVNFGDVHIDATNPDEGRAFLNKLAFLA